MKKMKSGFTLAEVLITLAIIGVVAAIVMPSVMSNYQYKSIGVKLGKFVSTVEAASRPFVVNNDNFYAKTTGSGSSAKTTSNVTDFINESFIFKTFDPSVTADSKTKILSYPNVSTSKLGSTYNYTAQVGSSTAPIATLKDGTSIQVYLDDTAYTTGGHLEIVPVEKFGKPVFRINFDPKVQGLSSANQKNFNFTVTELGYVFPSEGDACTWELYNEGFTTTSKSFEAGTSCHVSTTK